MKLHQLIEGLEHWAPPSYQESYDNSRLICGDPQQAISKALCTLDCTEDVVQEAIDQGANVIIAHHPIVFSGLKSFTGKNYVERTVIKAIQNNIAIYALHTNLDAISTGVNHEIGRRLNLNDLRILQPKQQSLKKLYTFVPKAHHEKVQTALFEVGAGAIGGYDHCSFNTSGTGTFRGGDDTNQYVGEKKQDHQESEIKIEVIFPDHLENQIIQRLKKAHPYEEVAFDIVRLDNEDQTVGSGMIGELSEPMEMGNFLKHLSTAFNAEVLRYTNPVKGKIKTIAFCGGSGSFLLDRAKRMNADVFITGDFKYHQFFDAENSITIIDIGHFEFEQFTPHLIQSQLAKIFPTFAVLLSGVKTNPVQYFIS